MRARPIARKGFSIVSLDLRKAFDSVSHCSISRALDGHGVDQITKHYIMGTLLDFRTTIKVGGYDTTRPISIRRGIKRVIP